MVAPTETPHLQATDASERRGRPDNDEIRRHLGRVLSSRAFVNAPGQQRFLKFVVEETLEGRGGDLKEFVIGTEVLGRPQDYDPRGDAAVRVAARRLRQRLHEYYETEGRDETVRIILLAGSYLPGFENVAAASATGGESPPRRRAATRRVWIAASAVGAIGFAAALALWARGYLPGLAGRQPAVVAILPFQNATANPDNAHVCFGFVEELTTRLARMKELRVVARTSASQFESSEDVQRFARRLGATAIVEGSVRSAGNRLRITAQLIRVSDGSHLWAETYERDPADLFGMQDEVARAVASAIADSLVGRPSPAPPPQPRANPAALDAYWRGRYFRSLRTEEDRQRSLEFFERAIAADPGFAAAHSAAAEVLATLAYHAEIPTVAGAARAKAAASRALALDDSIPEAHATLAWVAFFHDWDWAKSQREFRRALDLNPSYAGARQLYAHALGSRGRFDEAVAESQAALALDPVSYATSSDLAVVYYLARRFEDGIRQGKRVLDTTPNAHVVHGSLGVCYIGAGRHREGAAEFEKAIAVYGRHSYMLARLGQAQVGLGNLDAARVLAGEVEAAVDRGDATLTHFAILLAALGEKDRAIDCLVKAAEHHETDVVYLGVDPAFDPLRGDPRFRALLRQLRLSD